MNTRQHNVYTTQSSTTQPSTTRRSTTQPTTTQRSYCETSLSTVNDKRVCRNSGILNNVFTNRISGEYWRAEEYLGAYATEGQVSFYFFFPSSCLIFFLSNIHMLKKYNLTHPVMLLMILEFPQN